MPVVKYGNNLAFHIGETPETVIRLKKNFGKDNVYERSWYTKEYDVNGKKVPVVMAASYSVSGNPSDRNRADRSLALKQARVNYGMHAKHDTKYFKTKKLAFWNYWRNGCRISCFSNNDIRELI